MGPPCPISRVCKFCNKEFKTIRANTFCSSQCQHKLSSIRTSKWLSTHRDHIKGPHRKSYMEKSFEEWLQKHNIQKGMSGYLPQLYFFNNETKKNAWADYVFPRLRLIIELDGTHHEKRKHLDDIRDQYLLRRGWKVIRITITEYKNQSRVEEIKQLLHIMKT